MMYRVSKPLAETQFPGDDKKNRKTKKVASAKRKVDVAKGKAFSPKNAKERGFTSLSPQQIKSKKAEVLRLEKTDPAKGKAARASLMKELKKGYYKR